MWEVFSSCFFGISSTMVLVPTKWELYKCIERCLYCPFFWGRQASVASNAWWSIVMKPMETVLPVCNLKGCFHKILFHKVNGVCIDFTHGAVMFYTTLLVSVEINIIQIYNSIHYLLYIVYFQAKRDWWASSRTENHQTGKGYIEKNWQTDSNRAKQGLGCANK